mgnify:CR=1 FL=1
MIQGSDEPGFALKTLGETGIAQAPAPKLRRNAAASP